MGLSAEDFVNWYTREELEEELVYFRQHGNSPRK